MPSEPATRLRPLKPSGPRDRLERRPLPALPLRTNKTSKTRSSSSGHPEHRRSPVSENDKSSLHPSANTTTRKHSQQPDMLSDTRYLNFGDTLTEHAEVWEHYLQEATIRDKDMLTSWSQNMDALLVFSGLFSAVVTTFLVDAYKLLQPDPQQMTNALLLNIAQSFHALANNATIPVYIEPSDQNQTTVAATFVNCAWFASLAFTLAASLIILLVKQLILGYGFNIEVGSQQEQAHCRQQRRDALRTWHIPSLINSLPTILHVSLGLFFVGLVVQLQAINTTNFIVTVILVGSIFMFYMITTVSPLFNSSCPFDSPMCQQLVTTLHSTIIMINIKSQPARLMIHRYMSQLPQGYPKLCHVFLGLNSSTKQKENSTSSLLPVDSNTKMSVGITSMHRKNQVHSMQPLRHDERITLTKNTETLSMLCVSWLANVSHDQDVINLTINAIIGTPLYANPTTNLHNQTSMKLLGQVLQHATQLPSPPWGYIRPFVLPLDQSSAATPWHQSIHHQVACFRALLFLLRHFAHQKTYTGTVVQIDEHIQGLLKLLLRRWLDHSLGFTSWTSQLLTTHNMFMLEPFALIACIYLHCQILNTVEDLGVPTKRKPIFYVANILQTIDGSKTPLKLNQSTNWALFDALTLFLIREDSNTENIHNIAFPYLVQCIDSCPLEDTELLGAFTLAMGMLAKDDPLSRQKYYLDHYGLANLGQLQPLLVTSLSLSLKSFTRVTTLNKDVRKSCSKVIREHMTSDIDPNSLLPIIDICSIDNAVPDLFATFIYTFLIALDVSQEPKRISVETIAKVCEALYRHSGMGFQLHTAAQSILINFLWHSNFWNDTSNDSVVDAIVSYLASYLRYCSLDNFSQIRHESICIKALIGADHIATNAISKRDIQYMWRLLTEHHVPPMISVYIKSSQPDDQILHAWAGFLTQSLVAERSCPEKKERSKYILKR
ncbi:hypothetical protein PLICRDRAFT_646284 [Plicaturopsis crispa FD-325 SS-3]|nr:hypothetical protein PLICRDRAFT_646284 [Plicaturopsis crispa FD-325 SS-3]